MSLYTFIKASDTLSRTKHNYTNTEYTALYSFQFTIYGSGLL